SELENVRRSAREEAGGPDQWREQWKRGHEALVEKRRQEVAPIVRNIVANSGIITTEGSVAWNKIADKVVGARAAGISDAVRQYVPEQPRVSPTAETVTQAAEAWLGELQRTNSRPQTLDGHRLRVRAFGGHCGDIPLASVTRAMASDFLTSLTKGRSNRTVNNYAMTMQCLFKSARNRGRFQGENPFEDQRRKASGEKREAFTAAELHKIFA